MRKGEGEMGRTENGHGAWGMEQGAWSRAHGAGRVEQGAWRRAQENGDTVMDCNQLAPHDWITELGIFGQN
jgi:hypothetical protein